MVTILIVDDEKEIQNVLKEYCIHEGFSVLLANDGYEALEQVEKNNVDLILMDIMMPNLDGYKTVEEINKLKNIPIIMMSAKNEEYDKLKGFDLGIEDYVTKPFSPKEVIARIKTILKRTMGFSERLIAGNVSIDTKARKVYLSNKEIALNNKEFVLLVTLIKNKNTVMTREKLLNEVWGFDYEGDDRTIDAHIKMLRAKLGNEANKIKTIHGVGYKFEI